MPELPEVETVRRTVAPLVVDRVIESIEVREPRLRERVDVRRLRRLAGGRRITGVRRRAKYLLFDVEGGAVVLLHLGMTGKLRLVRHGEPWAPHDHVAFTLSDGRELRFNDTRRFGMVSAFSGADEARHPRLSRLGVEPLEAAFTPASLYAASRGSRQPVKSFLMDGARVVGVGNIYACEALYRAAIRPTKAVGRLTRADWDRLVAAVRETLRDAIEQGGTTLRDFVDAEGVSGAFAQQLDVYGREGQECRRCGGEIRRAVIAGRSTFYCARCQR